MLMPSSEAVVPSPVPVLQTSSRRQTSLCSRQVQWCRSRADELEMREKEHMKAQTCLGARERQRERKKKEHEGSTAFSRRCTAAANAGETHRRRSQDASHEVATELRDVERPTQPCKGHSSATAQQCKKHSRTRRTIAADRISHREPHAVCGSNDTAKLADRPDRKNTISDMLLLSRVSGRDENFHFMSVDTAREQRDRHFMRTREGEVACE